jgi:flagellar export protein FliJ
MSFRFALAPLLRLRQSLERQRAMRLREAALALARVNEALSRTDRLIADTTQSDEASLRLGRSAAELQFSLISRANMLLLRRNLHAELRRLELKRQEAATAYQRAYREREVLETLAVQQRHTYQQEQRQREQRELDDTHLLQLWRKRVD